MVGARIAGHAGLRYDTVVKGLAGKGECKAKLPYKNVGRTLESRLDHVHEIDHGDIVANSPVFNDLKHLRDTMFMCKHRIEFCFTILINGILTLFSQISGKELFPAEI